MTQQIDPIRDHLCPSVAKRSRRGGRRPGAGAPRGNMNALKTGAYSKQFALLGRLLAADPKVRVALLAIGARADRKQASANEVAALLFTRMVERAEDIAAGRPVPGARKRRGQPAKGLNLDLPVDDWDSIKEAAARLEGEMLK